MMTLLYSSVPVSNARTLKLCGIQPLLILLFPPIPTVTCQNVSNEKYLMAMCVEERKYAKLVSRLDINSHRPTEHVRCPGRQHQEM